MKIIKYLSVICMVIFLGCNIQDVDEPYEKKIVVFGNIQANLPMVDTLFVSQTASVDEEVDADELWITNANVKISSEDGTEIAQPVTGMPGRYLTRKDYIYRPGTKYNLTVEVDGKTLTAETTTPEKMEIGSIKNSDYQCKEESIPVSYINTNNAKMTAAGLITTGTIDTVTYRSGECYTASFASYPLFKIDFNVADYNTVRILTLALEAAEKDLEPEGKDYNSNGYRDSTFINLIYDTTRVYQLWKGAYFRDENNNPYRQNPFVWTVETAPVNMSWLFFNYYGLQLITVQATDNNYFEYLKGDPLGQNIYTMPKSNVDGGYGLFSSTYANFFFVYLKPE